MKFFIDSSAIDRLVDPNLEIRQKSLSELASILKNNILFEAQRQNNPQANDELLVINLDELIRKLILWFQYKPVTNENEVFDLLILIFNRKDFLKFITQSISIQRLRKEILKITKLLIAEESARKLQTIENILNDFEAELLVDVGIDNVSLLEASASVSNPNRGNVTDSSNDSLSAYFHRLQINSPKPSIASKRIKKEENSLDSWIHLEKPDLDIFNSIAANFVQYKEEELLKIGFDFLYKTKNDYPPEFYIQNPHIFGTLLEIFPKVPNIFAIEIINFVRFVLNGLKNRFVEITDQKCEYIPIKKHVNSIIEVLTTFFKNIESSNITLPDLLKKQELLNAIYFLIFDIISYIEETQNVCDIYLNEFFNSMAIATKIFRVAPKYDGKNPNRYRNNYIILIYLINALVSAIKSQNITKYSENNIWEYEHDMAVLDVTINLSHKQVYQFIKKSRNDSCMGDKDMQLLLEISRLWDPVVNIFQNWETLSDEEILSHGLKAIDTIRIYKSIEFVELMFRTIVRASSKQSKDQTIQNAAEEIFLRLLSIDVLEIRSIFYSLVKDSVQKMMIDDRGSTTNDFNLCSIVGIPLTTEIVTEVLCFGFTSTDEQIHKNAKLILFSFLRAKIIFPNYWSQILEIIRPVLPLMPCIFSVDHKIGCLAYDIFNLSSGFDQTELNLSYARFLFCNHAKTRDISKFRLLENLNEYSNDFIGIVPNDFCIIPENQVQDLQMPNKSVGYDKDAYKITSEMLKSGHNDKELLPTTLLHLSILMNSSELCKLAHDDNLWIFFIPDLDMGFPNNEVIRKLTIDILYKWVVSIPTFRIYLSNEPSVLKFLINTLTHFQDDVQIKKQASILLFLIVFSDFIVLNEKSISLPKFLASLQCPFKSQKHWTESPFDKISQLEWLFGTMEGKEDHYDIKNITRTYFSHTFAQAWFHYDDKLLLQNINSENMYYEHCSKNTLKVPEKISLSKHDCELIKEFTTERFIQSICKQLENLTDIKAMDELHHRVVCSTMLPNINFYPFAESLRKRIKKYAKYSNDCENTKKQMFLQLINLYQQIIPCLEDDQIASILGKKEIFITSFYNTPKEDKAYIHILNLINSIFALCESRKQLAGALSKTLNANQSSEFVEKLFNHLFETSLENESFKIISTTIRNVLHTLQVTLDEAFINSTFDKLLTLSKKFLKPKRSEKSNHQYSYALNQIFTIIHQLTNMSLKIELKAEHYSTLFLWLSDQKTTFKFILFLIIFKLTSRRSHFIEFCRGFHNSTRISFFNMLATIVWEHKISTANEQKALGLIIGNFLDHVLESNKKELDIMNEKNQVVLAIMFLCEKVTFIETTSYMVRKMLQNNIPEVVATVKHRRILENIMKNDLKQLNTILLCYSNFALKEHTKDIIHDIDFSTLIKIFSVGKEINGTVLDEEQKRIIEYTKIEKDILQILSIFNSSEHGSEIIFNLISTSEYLLENLLLTIFEGLKLSNNPNDIKFHMQFLISILDGALDTSASSNFFDDSETSRITKRFKLLISEKLAASNPLNFKNLFEKNFHKVTYTTEFLLLLVFNIFHTCDTTSFNVEVRYSIKTSCFIFIRKLLQYKERAEIFATKFLNTLIEKISLLVSKLEEYSYIEACRKFGLQKCQLKIKEFCILLKALTDWKIPLQNHAQKVKDLILKMYKISNWIEADSFLTNCFLNLVKIMSSFDSARSFVMHDINGVPLIKTILKKAQSLSVKPPHTEANLILLRNGISTMKEYCNMLEVRLHFKTSKVFQMLDILHTHVHPSRNSTWNNVTVLWMNFFEVLSRYEDSECTSGQISLICRLIRIGNSQIKILALKIIRNISQKSTIGHVVLTSAEFTETINLILSERDMQDEKILILQTLLNVAVKSEQMKSKLKNSPLNRQLKDHLLTAQSTHVPNCTKDMQILNLNTMLKRVLFSV